MPPPQHLLASKIRDFVCRSCLSKLQGPKQRRIQWTSRSLTTDTLHARLKGATYPASTTVEEAPDELEPEFNEESIIEALEEEFRLRRKDAVEHGVPKSSVRYFEETPDGTREEIQDGVEEENRLGALEREIEELKSETGGLMEKLLGNDPLQPGSSPLADELRAQIMEMERVDLKNLSELERQRLRSIVLEGSESGS